MSEDTMKKTLIVFHSRSGYTRRVAQALAQRLDADLDEIRIVQPMAGTLGYAFCALESLLHLTPALRPSTRDAADYPLVVVGTPVWFWNLSSPVRSWLAGNRLAKGRFAFFCTMGGSGAGRAFAAMQELAGGAPRATLAPCARCGPHRRPQRLRRPAPTSRPDGVGRAGMRPAAQRWRAAAVGH